LFFEIIRQQTLGCCLLAVPMRDTPEALQNILLSESEIVQSTVDGIPLFGLGVFTPSKDLELDFLCEESVLITIVG
jgi:hypothetical protein